MLSITFLPAWARAQRYLTKIASRYSHTVFNQSIFLRAESMTEPERLAMMESIKNACQNTMFEQWWDETKQPKVGLENKKPSSAALEGSKAADRNDQSERLQELVVYLAEDKSGRVDVQTAAKARYTPRPEILS